MKNIFVQNVDIDKTAYMNWRFDVDKPIENFIALAEGYIIAADCMIDSCIKNNSGKKADILIFPILFSINQRFIFDSLKSRRSSSIINEILLDRSEHRHRQQQSMTIFFIDSSSSVEEKLFLFSIEF